MRDFIFVSYLVFRLLLAYAGAVWVFAGGMKKREHFPLRVTVSMLAVALLSLLLQFAFSDHPTQQQDLSFNYQQGTGYVFFYLATTSILVLSIRLCFQCDFFKALALGASAAATRKIYIDAVSILECLGWQRDKIGEGWHALYSLAVMVLVYVLAHLVFRRRVQALFQSRFMWKNTVLSVAILLSVSVFSSMATDAQGLTAQASVYIYSYDIGILLLCLFMLYALFVNENLQTEKQFILQSLQMKQDYYRITKENIELINVKCHDMRHQLRHLETGSPQSEEYRRQVSEIINVYDNILKTGNEALDVVLTDKSLYCQKNHIHIICVADGRALDFMEDTDIYSLFGNLLDNAIEGVSKLTDEEQKFIHVNVRRKEEIVFIEVSNYFATAPRFEGHFPVTTKSDREYHGYGLRSIEMVAEKYGGIMNIKTDQSMFTVSVMMTSTAR
ncbi:MAG: sensor histidine kinase [Clostridia bacterium]|nr:sensor histidine kinase [Clostridia bacterium]